MKPDIDTAGETHRGPRGEGPRFAHAGLLALLAVAVAIAAGALFVKHRLNSFQEVLEAALRERTGVVFRLDSVGIESLRGVVVRDFASEVTLDNGAVMAVTVPEGAIDINLVDLLQGALVVDRLRVDGATLRVQLPERGAWGMADSGSGPMEAGAFRVLGSDCTLIIEDPDSASTIRFEPVDFDVYRLPDSEAVHGSILAQVGRDAAQTLRASVRYASPGDFDVQADLGRLAVADLNRLLPAAYRVAEGGSLAPRVQVKAWPDNSLSIGLETPFEGLTVANQPAFIETPRGHLAVHGRFDREAMVLDVSAARLESPAFEGRLDGTIDFAGPQPLFDLRLEVARLNAAGAIEALAVPALEAYGEVTLELSEPFELVATLHGTPANRIVSAHASIPAGQVAFTPSNSRFPRGNLRLAGLNATWNSETGEPNLSFVVADGRIVHEPTGIAAERITGGLHLRGDEIEIAPLNAQVTGHPLTGRIRYDLVTGDGEAEISGGFIGIEHTSLATAFKDTELAGAAVVQCNVVKQGDRYTVNGHVDATHTRIERQWWFDKPPGVDAVANVTGTLDSNRSAELDFDATIAASPVDATLRFARRSGRLVLVELEAESAELDVPTVGRCIRVPYRIAGTKARAGRYTWERVDEGGVLWKARGGAEIDDISLLPEGLTHPMVLRGVQVETEMTKGGDSHSDIVLEAERAVMPPMNTKWFVPLRQDAELLEKYPPEDRTFRYTLRADQLEAAPWSGRDFSGTAEKTLTAFALSRFSATVDDGRLEGHYRSDPVENAYETGFDWEAVPAHYFLEHLKLPRLMEGTVTGNLSYSLDRDDPGTLAGEGEFRVVDGQFSADYLLTQFGDQLARDYGGLPPSLAFGLLEADLRFARDRVETPSLHLESTGIDLQASGSFILDGDMNYDMKVQIAPDMAERIPALRDNLNIQGHRLAQQDIELAFKVTGPTLQPRGALTGVPPVSVTVASGVLAVTSEAFKVIDTPRKILVDLLKLGGGLVASPRSQE